MIAPAGRFAYLLQLLLLLVLLPAIATAAADAADADDDDATTPTTPSDNNNEATVTDEPEIVASIDVEIETADDGDDEESDSYDDDDDEERCDNAECRASYTKATAYVLSGEDAAVGAFRFAEEYSGLQDPTAETVLDVARKLEAELSSQNYAPPTELTHCGDSGKSNKKPRPCSAGKLWKRAEEMRKADMHDAAGADLLRALLKTGIEVDFVERCQRSLQWAFGSIQRQREREKREAVEEAKLEKRREEERAAMEEALERKKEYEADFVKFGKSLQESVMDSPANNAGAGESATVGADGNVQVQRSAEDLISDVKRAFVEAGPQGGNWNETVQLLRKIPGADKSVDVLLIEARCYEMLGNHKSALSAAGRLVQKAASHEPWINDSPRMMAATLGANAAMQLGLSENALSFYQTVLKFDPEQPRARKQYRGLKKVVKLMDQAEEQIQKGYNKAASAIVDDCMSAMRGLDVDSPLFRSKIQLKQCTILSAMGKHEEALENCDSAVSLRAGNDSVSPASQKEAHLARAEALLLDDDYDEAVQDFRAAFDLVPDDDETGEKRELHHKLQSTMHEQDMWNGGKMDNRFNEHTGYPDGRPPQRDHAKILHLPIDLEERGKDIKCAWLKKQFKLLVKKYHPDKYKGNKKRAARKFKEVKEAKEIMSKAWGC